MKKIQIFKLFFITIIPTKILAQTNHYTDYVYEHYLNGKPHYKKDKSEDIIKQEWAKESNRFRYYDYLIKTDKEIKENLKVKKIFDNDKLKSRERLKKTRQDLQNINQAIDDEIEQANHEREILEMERAKSQQALENTKNNSKPKKKAKFKLTAHALNGMYLQIGTGLSHLLPYNVSTKNSLLENNKTENSEYNTNLNTIIGYHMSKGLSAELEYSKQSFLNNEVTNLKENMIKRYTQNVKTSSFGINLMYPINFPTNKMQLSFGIGGGIAETFINDFGSVYMKNGEIVDKTIHPTADFKTFKSKGEKHNTSYLSGKLSSAVSLNKNINFVTSLKYDIFSNIKTDESVYLKNLSALNLSLGIKYKFN